MESDKNKTARENDVAAINGSVTDVRELTVKYRGNEGPSFDPIGSPKETAVGHNHPSGDRVPSQEDRAVTKRLQAAGELLSIPVLAT